MLIIVTAATSSPLTLEQARDHCRAPTDDDERLERALQSAVEYVEQQTELSLQPTVFEYRICNWPCWSGGFRRGHEIELPRKPVRDVVAVEYYDANGNIQSVDQANWAWRTTAEGAALRFKNSFSFPTLSCDEPEPVRVTFAAGYDNPAETGSGDDPNFDLPQRACDAVLLKVELIYEHGGMAPDYEKALQTSLNSLLGQLRVYR